MRWAPRWRSLLPLACFFAGALSLSTCYFLRGVLKEGICAARECHCKPPLVPPSPPGRLQVLKHLAGMPEVTMKWQTAASPLAPSPPIVRLLGYFLAGQTAQAQELLQASCPQGCRLWPVGCGLWALGIPCGLWDAGLWTEPAACDLCLRSGRPGHGSGSDSGCPLHAALLCSPLCICSTG